MGICITEAACVTTTLTIWCLSCATVTDVFFSSATPIENLVDQQENEFSQLFYQFPEKIRDQPKRNERLSLSKMRTTRSLSAGGLLDIPKGDTWSCRKYNEKQTPNGKFNVSYSLGIRCKCDSDCELFGDCCFYYEQHCMPRSFKNQDVGGSIGSKNMSNNGSDNANMTRDFITKIGKETDGTEETVTGNQMLVNNQGIWKGAKAQVAVDRKKSLLRNHMDCLTNMPGQQPSAEDLTNQQILTTFFWFVSSCPESPEQNISLSKKCNDPGIDIISNRPVYDPVTRFSFKNIYCARCHDVDHTKPWQVQISAQDVLSWDDVSYVDIISRGIGLNHPGSILHLSFLPNNASEARGCFPDVAKNKTNCNKVNDSGNYDADIERMCDSYSNPAWPWFDTGIIFNNIHCAVCSGAPFGVGDGCAGRFI